MQRSTVLEDAIVALQTSSSRDSAICSQLDHKRSIYYELTNLSPVGENTCRSLWISEGGGAYLHLYLVHTNIMIDSLNISRTPLDF